MKIDFDLVTTRTGDDGKSSDYSGSVDWKDAPVFEVLGDLDELTTHIMYMQEGKLLFFKDITALQEETGELKLGKAIARVMRGEQLLLPSPPRGEGAGGEVVFAIKKEENIYRSKK